MFLKLLTCKYSDSSIVIPVGTAMLPVVAFPFEDFYIDTHHMSHKLEPQEQQALFYTGLLAAALGIGGIRAILCPLGAYNLQSYNQYQLLGFFNWYVMHLHYIKLTIALALEQLYTV